MDATTPITIIPTGTILVPRHHPTAKSYLGKAIIINCDRKDRDNQDVHQDHLPLNSPLIRYFIETDYGDRIVLNADELNVLFIVTELHQEIVTWLSNRKRLISRTRLQTFEPVTFVEWDEPHTIQSAICRVRLIKSEAIKFQKKAAALRDPPYIYERDSEALLDFLVANHAWICDEGDA